MKSVFQLSICLFSCTLIHLELCHAQDFSKEDLHFFEAEVRPLLVKRCYECHADKQQKGDLRLDSRISVLQGGESGPAAVANQPDESLLIEAIHYDSFEMPPKGKLPEKEITILTKWVKLGLPWPKTGKDTPLILPKKEKITDEDRAYWAFQPLNLTTPAEADDPRWNHTLIDRFVYARQQIEGIKAAAPADKQTLLRRVSFDLTGLPPTDQIKKDFLADNSPHAYENLIDKLLASPQYGQHMASYWLDLVRYAESDGYRADYYRPQAWHYRDYVIRSFNEDKPYDQFVLEQLAGDEIENRNADSLIATGFLRHWIYEYNQRDVAGQWQIILEDITDTTGDVFLGLGMGCAKCHDHKFDPILQKDYYRLQGFFASILPRDDVPLATHAEVEQYQSKLEQWEAKTEHIRSQIEDLLAKPAANGAHRALIKFPPEIQEMMNKSAGERTPTEHQLAELAYRQVQIEIDKAATKLQGEQKEKYEQLQTQLAKIQKPKPLPLGYTVSDTGPAAPAVFIPDKQRLGEVELGFLSVIDPAPIEVDPLPKSTGRRTKLAQWITSDENHLANRVIANRIWQWCFGKGLVPTSNDFGHLGSKPIYPELLDYLTHEFIEGARSFKSLQRKILLSETYRQASQNDDAHASQTDPENRYLWKANIRRLKAEQVRDAMLAVSGELQINAGGASVSGDSIKRSIYVKVIRNSRDSLLDSFDFPLRFNSNASRNTTTTANQALLMINGGFPLARAKKLAGEIRKASPIDSENFVNLAYEKVFSRSATAQEQQFGSLFIEEQATRIQQEQEQLNQANTLVFSKLEKLKQHALQFGGEKGVAQLHSPSALKLPNHKLSIQAVVQLDSLYENADVRTIASQWDGNTASPGWNLGVTSTKSKYVPRNLILQLVGKDISGKLQYEVISSRLHLELGRPYQVQISADFQNAAKTEVEFSLLDLSDKNAKTQVAKVKYHVTQNVMNNFPLVIGGRSSTKPSQWHGKIASIDFHTEKINHGKANAASPIFLWKFTKESADPLTDQVTKQWKLNSRAPQTTKLNPQHEAQVDFCHLLFNSNEFLYLD